MKSAFNNPYKKKMNLRDLNLSNNLSLDLSKKEKNTRESINLASQLKSCTQEPYYKGNYLYLSISMQTRASGWKKTVYIVIYVRSPVIQFSTSMQVVCCLLLSDHSSRVLAKLHLQEAKKLLLSITFCTLQRYMELVCAPWTVYASQSDMVAFLSLGIKSHHIFSVIAWCPGLYFQRLWCYWIRILCCC